MSGSSLALAEHSAASERELKAAYRLIAELLLYPEERDRAAIEAGQRSLADAPLGLVEPIEAFLGSSRSEDLEEYLKEW